MTDLTERECEILQLAANGMTTAQIAFRLGCSPFTVRNHLRRIYAKLGVPNRAAATRAGMRLGMVR